MTLKVRRAAVLGAGVMGAQIAAHLAAAGVRTYLLDLASNEPPADKGQAKLVGKAFRSTRAILAIENLKQLKPNPLYTSQALASIIPGNFDDDMSVLADCDWILEAVVERLDIKQGIHNKIATYARPNVPVTTNTSGISLAAIAEGLTPEYRQRFFGTHFFNPPRYMRLLEIIPHPETDPKLLASVTRWIEERLGKGIVEARDTVNFIANRIGVFATQSALRHMGELKLNIETVDNLSGPLIGRAKSATFRTMDVVGLDTFAAVARNTYDRATQDPYRDWFKSPTWLVELIEKGALGQKSNSVGCYKKDKDAKGQTVILSYRPDSKTYVEQQVQAFPWEAEVAKEKDPVRRIKGILAQNDAGATFVWRAIRDVMSYASTLVNEISGGLVKPVDDALRWGFNWEMGPFELWQALGYDMVLERMKKDGVPLPSWAKPGVAFYHPAPGTKEWTNNAGPAQQFKADSGKMSDIRKSPWSYRLPTSENKDDPRVVMSNKSASIVDIGDGAACLVFHSKMNSIDFDIIEMTQRAVAKVQTHFDALVIGNDAPAFSAGANLKMIAEAIVAKRWSDIDRLIRAFQGSLQLVKFAPFPVVSAPRGLVLGGGCEVALHTALRVASGETYAGLVEVGVGLIPGGGGTKELALRSYEFMSLTERGDPMAFLQRAFMLIGMARTSGSAHEAVEMGLFPATTEIALADERVIDLAKGRALAMAQDGYVPKTPAKGVKVVGDPGIQTFKMMLYNMEQGRQVSPYDAFIAERVATVLCGGEVDPGTAVDEQWFLDLERRVFIELCQQTKTAERIEHMLKTGKPLRN
jgi:3-hydroxyacyl-CoA dehydrogenase